MQGLFKNNSKMNCNIDKNESLIKDTIQVNHQKNVQTYYSQMYRECTLGNRLKETIEEFLQAGKINLHLANRLLYQYDESIQNKIKTNLSTTVSLYIRCDANTTFIFKQKAFSLFLRSFF